MRIAIQGNIASFHHQAAQQWADRDVDIMPAETFDEVFGLLNRHDAELAIVAIENSLYGSIHKVYDLIEAHRYPIVGEIHLPIHQQLIGLVPDAKPTKIYSHTVALAQCQQYLDSHFPEAERIEYSDTAEAVNFIAQENNPNYAAIASKEAAKLYHLPILQTDIEDNPANFTRFLVIQPEGQVPPNADRSSLVLTTDHKPGALAKILTIIADAGINLSKLQSRPITGQPWKYRFYLVLDAAGPQLHAVLPKLRPLTRDLTVLGEYKHNL